MEYTHFLGLTNEQWVLINTIVMFLYWHWYSDFVQQTEYMALNKSKSNWVLLHHVSVQTFWISPAYIFVCLLVMPSPWLTLFVFLVGNLVIHFAIDWVTSRLVASAHAQGNTRKVFQIVGADQMCHYLTYLFLVFSALSNTTG